MKRLFFTLAIGLLLAGTASAQWGTREDRAEARELDRMRGGGSDTFYRLQQQRATRAWQDEQMRQWQQRDDRAFRQQQQRAWQGTGGGIRSNQPGGGW